MKVIFLDLDKTLIGDDYSPEPARDIVEELKKRGFRIVFNSSKTRAEQEYYREELGIGDPFIVENGSGIYIPKDYFPFSFNFSRAVDDYFVIDLGVEYDRIREVLNAVGDEFGLKYYANSTLEEIIAFTGLPEELAKLAMKREYSETVFRWEKEDFENALKARGLDVSRGSRFYNIHGKTDKGKAAEVLLSLYRRLGDVESYAVGDGLNDFPMLDIVDFAFIIGPLEHPRAKNISSLEEIMEVVK
ncbi:hypothetical protein PAP_01440 [Palaeococcus pacificus DY20341]|uniref:Mannosyl-3-phosphoglycerate phosphatase n=1 Tax=Palaeococcus pacificus DY20341 TaxID=1343739 RepID=A0A075LW80_9EURY|nr:mannosyl-3-phosphoglycerate phosphatase [Palaeococcus pacificus]AIF68728.1 hypothetical protein PAP_01440 [Palaeococcus pacificus DY20341]